MIYVYRNILSLLQLNRCQILSLYMTFLEHLIIKRTFQQCLNIKPNP